MKRYIGLILFITFLFVKLMILHSGLNAQNIDMNRLDKLISIGSLMLLSFWTLWLSRRGQTIALLCLNVLLTLLIYADIVYYRYFQDFITVPVLLQAGQMDALGDSIFALLQLSDLWLFADWLLVLCYVGIRSFLFRHSTFQEKKDIRCSFVSPTRSKPSSGMQITLSLLRRAGNGTAALLLGLVLTFGPIHSYATTWARELFTGNWWSLAMYNVTGLIGFHAYDAYQYARDHLGPQPVLSSEEAASMELWFNEHRLLQSSHLNGFGKYADSNIIVIQAEAFMNFVVGRSVEGHEITPNLNALLKESIYFSNYYHQTAQGRTSDADFTSNGSLYPLTAGSVFVRYPDQRFDVLPAILKEQGYSTNAFHAYEGSFWNRHFMYKAMGYDYFYSKKDFNLDEPLGWSLGDKSFLRQSLDIMDTASTIQKPFYSFLTTLTSHYPYSLPADLQELDTGAFTGTIFGDYLQAVHYTDAALGELVDEMKRHDLWDSSILVFYGDHDNSINETAFYEQFLGKSLSAIDMHQIMHQVPLLIHLPGESTARIDSKPAGQLDLAPSLLHLLGIPLDSYYMMGNNLFSGQERLVTLRTGAFANATVAYIPGDDRQFDNGVCYSLATHEPVDLEQCRIDFNESRNRLQISDHIMKYDAIKVLENKRLNLEE